MRIRLAGVNDLHAADGKYHLKCLSKFKRQCKSSKAKTEADDFVMTDMCLTIEKGLSRGHVYDMNDVWNSYKRRRQEIGQAVPKKYESRKQTFYEDLKKSLSEQAEYVRPLAASASLLLYPKTEANYVISKSLTKATQKFHLEAHGSESESESDSSSQDPVVLEPCETSILQELVHVALKIRSDLLDTAGHDSLWEGIDMDHIEKIIPESLFLLLRIIFGGMNVLEKDESEINKEVCRKVCSIAQDVIFGVSNGTKLTPKHIGLGLALHQATRSEMLVNLFHSANHTVGINTIRRIDNSIANNILERYIENGCVYIPNNIKRGVFAHFSCDNIDVLESTLDGRNTFHSTQMVLWQRKSADITAGSSENRPSYELERKTSTETLRTLHELDKAELPHGRRPELPNIQENLDAESWFKDNDVERAKATVMDIGWLIARQVEPNDQSVPAWRAYNECSSPVNPPMTNIGILPILQAPADEYDTITTVINRFVSISNHIGQTHTVITADQPLYAKGMELVWANNEKFGNVIFRLGGLHVCFNFLKAIGQYVESAGLDDLWIESGLYPANVTENMLTGKAYYRAVRAHTLTYEALWRLRWVIFRAWIANKGIEYPELEHVDVQSVIISEAFSNKVYGYSNAMKTEVDKLNDAVKDSKLIMQLKEFDEMCKENSNYDFWITYMGMVKVLLDFIRAEREGNWPLHLEAFTAMLPWLTAYDHLNYARWGPIYLTEMLALESKAPSVYHEFVNGNFVVKRSDNHFSQLPTDQATEWMNKICKMNNGIIGITRNDQARDKFCITWGTRSNVSQTVRALFGDTEEEQEHTFTRHDSLPSRVALDEEHVQALLNQLDNYDIFCRSGINIEDLSEDQTLEFEKPISDSLKLVSLATKDVASDEVMKDLFEAETKGVEAVVQNVQQRLISKEIGFFHPMKKRNLKTFAVMYQVSVVSQQKCQIVKADRKLLQRLLTAAHAGRTIEIASILKHELSPVPLSLAKVGGAMNTTSKSDLMNLLTSDMGVGVPEILPDAKLRTCTIIDGHALIQVIGKPTGYLTFGDYADHFLKSVIKNFNENTTRVDVTFDRYLGRTSIKSSTRDKRVGKRRPIRKLVSGPEVPLPQVWEQFIAMDENKADLAHILSEALTSMAHQLPQHLELVTSGGFKDILKSTSNRREVLQLSSNHEEADTRLILHALDAKEAGYERIVVNCRDTDVFLLLVYHLGRFDIEVWMLSGIAKKMKCFPAHVVAKKLPASVNENILGFHPVTGCDTTSAFAGIGKKTCWRAYMQHPLLLAGVGRDDD